MIKAPSAQPAREVVRVFYVENEQQIREMKQRALVATRVKPVAADVREACGFMPMNIQGAVAHWRGL